jgi:hypothetical protein
MEEPEVSSAGSKKGAAVTVFTKKPTPTDATALLSKKIALCGDQVVHDSSACRMVEGTAKVVSAATAEELKCVIESLGSNNAIALGVSEHPEARVTTVHRMQRLNKHARGALPVITRTREFINYRTGPAWMLLDYDRKGLPDSIAQVIDAAGGPGNVLASIIPGLAGAARVTRASTSSGLRRSDTGEDIAGSGGEHSYVLVADGQDIGRALQALHQHCWLHEFGWYHIGAAGQLLERSLVDVCVRFGERLCFEAPPEIVPPLVQDTDARSPVAYPGPAFDTRRAVPHTTAYEQARIAQAQQHARAALEPSAAVIRNAADRCLAEKISSTTDVPFASATRVVMARHHGRLLPSIELDFDHHEGPITVEQVLAEPDRFVGETLCDPLEGESYGRDKAMVMRSAADASRLFIHSFAHGRSLYDLLHDVRTVRAAIEAADPKYVVDILSSLVPLAELEADELTSLIAAAAAKNEKIGVRAIGARLRVERKKRDQAAHKAAHDKASIADRRLSHPLPPPDGELSPIVNLVDETLAADPSEEPPMRDANGNIIGVCIREPWGLHRLTATGSNAEPLPEGQEALPPAPEPGLVVFTAVKVALLIEEHLRFDKPPTVNSPGYAARLQRPYVEAAMSLGADNSLMPIARAIVTAPIVAKNGCIIAGVGLDRSTGLVYRIEPGLLSCILSTPDRNCIGRRSKNTS